jgi:Tyrosine-protein kinase ephrin type A/B receptor-like
LFGSVSCSACPAGRYATSRHAASSCNRCSIGRFSDSDGATNCTACESGSTTSTEGSVQCNPCPAGAILNTSIHACQQCPPGYFTNVSSSTSCQGCPSGSFSSSFGSVSCSLCPAGRYATSPNAASSCSKCSLGYFTDTDGSTNCLPCDSGSSTSVEGSVQCVDCPAGRFQNQTTLACEACSPGYFSNDTKYTSCDVCTAGSISSTFGAVSCSACPAGRYATSILAASSCESCAIGRFTNTDGTTNCSLCAAGSSTSAEGAVQCTPCPAGEYRNASTLACEQCLPGFFTNTSSSTLCHACPSGSVSSTFGSVSCSACPAGRYAPFKFAASSCSKCAVGRFSEFDGSITCSNCLPGSSTTLEGSVQCTECPAGRFQNQTSLKCEPCPTGHFSNMSSQISCSQCALGSVAMQVGSVACSACAAGRFHNVSDSVGTSFCQPCATGYFSSTDGQTSCSSCSPGAFSNIVGSVGCVECPAGRFSNTNATSDCAPCAQHHFAPTPGLTSCMSCAELNPFWFSNRTGAQFCEQCDKQRYLVFVNRSDVQSFEGCIACPPNADCSSGQPRAEETYWLNMDPNTGRASVVECSNPAACPGFEQGCGENRPPALANLLCASCNEGFQEVDGECVECTSHNYAAIFIWCIVMFCLVQLFYFLSQGGSSYVGVVSYFVQTVVLFMDSQTNAGIATILSVFDLDPIAASSSNSSCVLRMSDSTRILSGLFGPLLALLSWCILFALWQLISQVCPNRFCRHQSSSKYDESHESMPGFAAPTDASSMPNPVSASIPAVTAQSNQVLRTISRRLSGSNHVIVNTAVEQSSATKALPWCCCLSSESQKDCLWVLHGCYFAPTSQDRSSDSSLRGGPGSEHCHWRLSTVQPLLYQDNQRVLAARDADFHIRWLRTLLALFLLTFNGVTRTALTPFFCIDIDTIDGVQSVVQAFPSVTCSGSEYNVIVALASSTLSVYVVVPLLLIWLYPHELLPRRVVACFVNRCTLSRGSENDINNSKSAAQPKTASPNTVYVLGALTAAYRRGHSTWWKLFVLIRRLGLVIAVVAIEDRGWRMIAASLISLSVLMLHILTRPFENMVDNVMESISLLSLTLIATMLLKMQPPYSSQEQILLGVLWTIPFFVIVGWAVIGWILRGGPVKRAMATAVKQRFTEQQMFDSRQLMLQNPQDRQHTPSVSHGADAGLMSAFHSGFPYSSSSRSQTPLYSGPAPAAQAYALHSPTTPRNRQSQTREFTSPEADAESVASVRNVGDDENRAVSSSAIELVAPPGPTLHRNGEHN